MKIQCECQLLKDVIVW